MKHQVKVIVTYEDDTTPYSSCVLFETEDLFRAQAAFDILKDTVVGKDNKHELIIGRTAFLKALAEKHQHPSFPCALKDDGKKWVCGERFR